MLQNFAFYCYLVFLILSFVSPFLPLYLVWRVFSFAIVAFIAGKLIEGPVHWSNKNAGYALGSAVLLVFMVAIITALSIRLAAAVATNGLTHKNISGPDNEFKSYFDTVALGFAGCVAGLLLTIIFTDVASESSLGIFLDLGIAIFAAIAAVSVLFIIAKKYKTMLFATLATIAILAGIGSFQTSNILKAGEKLAHGRPWCLITSGSSKQIFDISQLGFFSLPKNTLYPRLGLLMRVDKSVVLMAHWSIRQQAFVPTGSPDRVSSCYPIQNYATKLTDGTIERDVYAVGSDVYTIPKKYIPIAKIASLSIRSDLLVGAGSALPKISERIKLSYSDRAPRVPKGALPLQKIPNTDELTKLVITGKNKISFAGADKSTERYVIIDCLRGPFIDRNCRIQVFEGLRIYDYKLPLHDISDWSKTTDQVKALFLQFRHDKT